MFFLAALMSLFSLLIPTKMWFEPMQPVSVRIERTDAGELSLALTTFDGGKRLDPASSSVVSADTKSVADLRTIFPVLNAPGTFVLYAVPKDKSLAEFVGTPVVIQVKQDSRPGIAGTMVTHLEPLRYAVMTTAAGSMTMIFYCDVAPNTVDSFLRLGEEGFFDGLAFHRIVPGFVLQGGDPRWEDPQRAGTGGPGYSIDAEFNDHPHEEGVLSMARNGDPDESLGNAPRPEFANSAGSQFFVCLDYKQTKQLDRRYTAFGRVVQGLDVMHKLGETPIADPRTGRPVNPPLIEKVDVLPVTAQHNPYAALLHIDSAPGTPMVAPAPATKPVETPKP